MLKYLKAKLSSVQTSEIFNALITIIPASILYYMSTLLTSIGALSISWQILLPLIVTTAVTIGGYNYLNDFIEIIKATLRNIWQSIRYNKKFIFPGLDMSVLVSLSLISNIVYGLILGPSASLVIYAAPLVTLAALNISNYLKNIINIKLDAKANKKLEIFKAKLPSNEEFNTILEGHVVVVKPGMLIPVDSYLLTEQALIKDGTMKTGEQNSISKFTKNQLLHAGTEYVGTTPIQIVAKTHGTLSPIYSLLQLMAQRVNKSKSATAIDYISMLFVPVVLSMSIITFSTWALIDSAAFGLKAMMDVLFAACPCALGFANTIPYGILKKKLFNNSIYIHNDAIIDKFPYADTIVFDKTGTLTKISLASVEKFSDDVIDYQTILAIQKLRVSHNKHERASDPFANELINILAKQHEKSSIITKIKLIDNKSNGIAAHIDCKSINKKIYMGNLLYLEQNKFDINSVQTNANTSDTTVYLAIEQDGERHIQACFNFSQKIRDDARETVIQLQNAGYNILMLTGDKHENAEIIAKQLGIKYFKANCTPESKQAFIKKLVSQYKSNVVMVGDGFNDYLPAAEANIGSIAIGKQSIMSGFFDLTIENLSDILKLKSLFKAATKTQNQVFGFSLVYNFLAMLFAAVIFPISGMVAMTGCFGTCMALSSLIATAWSCSLLPKLSSIFNKFKSQTLKEVKSNSALPRLSSFANNQLNLFTAKTTPQSQTEFNLDSNSYPEESQLYAFNMDVHAVCGNCAKHFDTYMNELKPELDLDNYNITNNGTTYTISFFLQTAEVKNILSKFKEKFAVNGKTILKEPTAKPLKSEQTRSHDAANNPDPTSANETTSSGCCRMNKAV